MVHTPLDSHILLGGLHERLMREHLRLELLGLVSGLEVGKLLS